MQLKDLKGPKVYKRVAVDLNIKFIYIDSIKEAIGKRKKRHVQRQRRQNHDPKGCLLERPRPIY